MHRRDFLAVAATAALSRIVRAADPPQDVRITRAVGFTLPSRRSKVAGKNARLDVHGDTASDRMVRLYTNAGVEALGNCRADEQAVAELIGKDPFAFYRPDERRMVGPLGTGTMPLWDLLGKLLGKPAYELLGGAGTAPVPVYDGSIYFADLLPQYAANWQDRFREEIDMGLAIGHRAFKIKIGRGAKWMPREAGDDRDVEVVTLIRNHAGDEAILGVDANNGYDLAGTKRFLDRVADAKLAFIEEPFDEKLDDCLALKRFIADQGWSTLLADGETQREPEPLRPFAEAGAIDVFQGDMNQFGFEGILLEAAWAKPKNLLIAPHNWGSLVGYYMQLHAGRAIENFYRAEHDPLTSRVLIAEGYDRKNGASTVPDAPGFGLSLVEKAFAEDARVLFDVG
ncbi:MAG: enolase C-terminal domain-like protein [Planctomycetaceae bacterium]